MNPEFPTPPKALLIILSDIFGDWTMLVRSITNRRSRFPGEVRISGRRGLILDLPNIVVRYLIQIISNITRFFDSIYGLHFCQRYPSLLNISWKSLFKMIISPILLCYIISINLRRMRLALEISSPIVWKNLARSEIEYCLFVLFNISREYIGPKDELNLAKRVFPNTDDISEMASEFIRIMI